MPVEPLPRRSLVHDALGRASDELLWPCTSPKPDCVLLCVPGNPGLADFYLDFLGLLHQRHGARIEIVAASHCGNSPHEPLPIAEALRLPGQRPLPMLADQVEVRCRLVDRLRKRHGRDVPIVLAGHSMGVSGARICRLRLAHYGCEVLKARPDDKQLYIYGLFATVSNLQQTRNGVSLRLLFLPPVIWLVTVLLIVITSLIPRSLLRLIIVRTYGVKSASAAPVMLDLIANPTIASTALWLTPDELERIGKLDETFIAAHADRLSFYYAADESDGWVRNSSVVEIASALERSLSDRPAEVRELRRRRVHRCEKGSAHAFVLKNEDTRAVAAVIGDWLEEDFLQ